MENCSWPRATFGKCNEGNSQICVQMSYEYTTTDEDRSRQSTLVLMSDSQSIPVIETARLKLRPHVAGDFDACAALWGDPLVTRYITGKPLTGEEVWSRLLRHAGHWQWLGFGYWALEEKASRLLIGELGFADYQRAIEPSISGTPELGYTVASHAQGRGYAAEALAAAIAWSDERFQDPRTVCLVSPENRVSLVGFF